MRLSILGIITFLGIFGQKGFSLEDATNGAMESSEQPISSDQKNLSAKKSKGYNISLGFSKPTFSSGLSFYEKLYGEAELYPTFGVDWFFNRSAVGLGIGWRLGYYDVSGRAAKKPRVSNPSPNEIVKDTDKTTLTLIPMDFLFLSRISFADSDLVVLSGAVGYQDMYYQETRLTSVESSNESGSSQKKEESKRQITKGWNGSAVLSVSADIKISQFNSRSSSSLKTMGFGQIFISPYIKVVSKLGEMSLFGKAGHTDFSRTELGLAVLFEGI